MLGFNESTEPDRTEVDVEQAMVNFLEADVMTCEEPADRDTLGVPADCGRLELQDRSSLDDGARVRHEKKGVRDTTSVRECKGRRGTSIISGPGASPSDVCDCSSAWKSWRGAPSTRDRMRATWAARVERRLSTRCMFSCFPFWIEDMAGSMRSPPTDTERVEPARSSWRRGRGRLDHEASRTRCHA